MNVSDRGKQTRTGASREVLNTDLNRLDSVRQKARLLSRKKQTVWRCGVHTRDSANPAGQTVGGKVQAVSGVEYMGNLDSRRKEHEGVPDESALSDVGLSLGQGPVSDFLRRIGGKPTMHSLIEFNHQKATQAINFFASQAPNGRISKMRVIKLIWLADRYHLRHYGRPIIGDQYWAMPFGPVGSSVKDIAEASGFLADEERDYSGKYLRSDGYEVESIARPDLDVLSATDIEALRVVRETVGSHNKFQLVELSHAYPEWSKFREQLASKQSSRERMSYIDFFGDSPTIDKFRDNPETVRNAKSIFEEDWELAWHWL